MPCIKMKISLVCSCMKELINHTLMEHHYIVIIYIGFFYQKCLGSVKGYLAEKMFQRGYITEKSLRSTGLNYRSYWHISHVFNALWLKHSLLMICFTKVCIAWFHNQLLNIWIALIARRNCRGCEYKHKCSSFKTCKTLTQFQPLLPKQL